MLSRGSTQQRASSIASGAAARAGVFRSPGYQCLHHGHRRLLESVYSEILNDECKDTATGFWTQATTFFESLEVTVEAVMTDNGSCYRSQVFKNALGAKVTHRFTWAYPTQNNSKDERPNNTLMTEWTYGMAVSE